MPRDTRGDSGAPYTRHTMKTRTIVRATLAAAVLAGIAGGGVWWWQQRDAAAAPQFRTGKVERGSITATVTASGVDLAALATTLQIEGRDAFNKSWADLLAKISAKREALAAAR